MAIVLASQPRELVPKSFQLGLNRAHALADFGTAADSPRQRARPKRTSADTACSGHRGGGAGRETAVSFGLESAHEAFPIRLARVGSTHNSGTVRRPTLLKTARIDHPLAAHGSASGLFLNRSVVFLRSTPLNRSKVLVAVNPIDQDELAAGLTNKALLRPVSHPLITAWAFHGGRITLI